MPVSYSVASKKTLSLIAMAETNAPAMTLEGRRDIAKSLRITAQQLEARYGIGTADQVALLLAAKRIERI